MSKRIRIIWKNPSVDEFDLFEKMNIDQEQWGSISEAERDELIQESLDDIRDEFFLQVKEIQFLD